MRIVSLISSGTEILFALGLGRQVLGVSHECDYPPDVRGLPRLTRSWIDSSRASGQIDDEVKVRLAAGGSLYEIDAETLCRLRPDLIVTQAQCDVCAVRYADVVDLAQSRPELAGAKIVALNPHSLADVFGDIGRIAVATGAEAAAESVLARLRHSVSAIERATSELADSERPRVVCLEWCEPLMAAGNWTPQLIELAGGRSCLAGAGAASDYVAWEAVRAADPDVLLIAPCGFDLARSRIEAAALARLPGLADLAAIRSGRAFILDGNAYLNRSGPRLVDTLELLAGLLHSRRVSPLTGELAEGRAWARWSGY